jgi:hypothetical protein
MRTRAEQAKPLRLRLMEAEHPRGVTNEPILWLHRHDDGFVHFMRSENGSVTPLRSVRISTLRAQPFLPNILSGNDIDVFVSMNAFLRERRRTEELRYLNAAYVDMDFYVREANGSIQHVLQFSEAVGLMLRLSEDGIIPPPSIYVRSGNGAWLLWLLHDPLDPSHSPKAFPEKRAWLLNIQTRIRDVIRQAAAKLNPDDNASDLARVLRVPGSHSSKAERQVVWLGAFDERNELPSYTLDDLGDSFGIPHPVRPARKPAGPKPRTGAEPTKRENSGWRALWQQRLEDLRLISANRGGYREGYRHDALLYHAICMGQLGFTEAVITEEITRQADSCNLSRSDARRAIASGTNVREKGEQKQRGYKWKNVKVALQLRVTLEEANELGLKQVRPDFKDKHAARYGHSYADSPTRGTRAAKTAHRRTLVKQQVLSVLAATGAVPSCRDLVEMLAVHGEKSNPETVRQDLIALELHAKTLPSRQRLLIPEEDTDLVN